MGLTKRTVFLLFGTLLVAPLGALPGVLWPVLLGYALIVCLLFVLDWRRSPGKKALMVSRRVDAFLEQRRPSSVELTLTNTAGVSLNLVVCDAPPPLFAARHEAQTLTLAPGETHRIAYTVCPAERGSFAFGGCHVALTGRWGLCVKRFVLPCPGTTPVYPDLTAMRKYQMLTKRNLLSREDAALQRLRGGGSEFENIREYVSGDDTRRVNWMATARMEKPMTNTYQVEKNREVLVAIDTGRWMGAPMGVVTRLDRTLENAAALMQVSLISGDRVGLVLFDSEVQLYVPPDKGQAQMNKLLAAMYNAAPTRRASGYAQLSGEVLRRFRKRGLVFLFSFFEDDEAARAAAGELSVLASHHALTVVSLFDPSVDEILRSDTENLSDLALKGAGAYRETAQTDAAHIFNRQGDVVASDPHRVLPELVRKYMLLKRKI